MREARVKILFGLIDDQMSKLKKAKLRMVKDSLIFHLLNGTMADLARERSNCGRVASYLMYRLRDFIIHDDDDDV